MKPFPHGECPTCGGSMMTDGTSSWCGYDCGEPRRVLKADDRRRVLREERAEKAKEVRAQK